MKRTKKPKRIDNDAKKLSSILELVFSTLPTPPSFITELLSLTIFRKAFFKLKISPSKKRMRAELRAKLTASYSRIRNHTGKKSGYINGRYKTAIELQNIQRLTSILTTISDELRRKNFYYLESQVSKNDWKTIKNTEFERFKTSERDLLSKLKQEASRTITSS